jgi:drug/metabolite transporter (DMT)-like permease
MTLNVSLLVLMAAVMHASWNAALRSGRDRFWTGCAMSLFSASGCLLTIPFLPIPHRECWGYIIASSVVHVFYNLLLVRMYRRGHFGVTYPVARGSSPLLITLGATILSSELISRIHLVGVVLVSAGILVLALSSESLHRESIAPALSTGASIAIYSLVDGLGVRRSGNALSYTVWMMMLQGVSMALVFLAVRPKADAGLLAGRSARDLTQAGCAGLVSVTGYGIVIWAMKGTPMGMVSALRETSVLFAAIIGRLFLQEPFNARKVLAAILISLGAICLH